MDLSNRDFRARYMEEPHIAALVEMLVGALVDQQIDVADVARCSVLASQLYAERYRAPVFIRLAPSDPILRTVHHVDCNSKQEGCAPECTFEDELDR